MKRINRNLIVFILVGAFIAAGFNKDMLVSLKTAFSETKDNAKVNGISAVTELPELIENKMEGKLTYHSKLMNIYSGTTKVSNAKIVVKDDTVIVKTDDGRLSRPEFTKATKKGLGETVNRVAKLNEKARKSGTRFLYVAVPTKEYYAEYPPNIEDYTKYNYDLFIKLLKSRKIPTYDCSNLLSESSYFVTDHHWQPKSAFSVANAVSKELHGLYGFSYNRKYQDLKNYDVKTYKDYFLGSLGKKTGVGFATPGVDDFDLITPKFDTEFTVSQPIKNETKTGIFRDTVLDLSNMGEKDYFVKNPYATYSGGDFRLQIMKNEKNPDGKKILLVRDSFACAFAPFFALQTGELHTVDLRNFDYFVGDKVNVYDYIDEIKPDCVIVMLGGIKADLESSGGAYDFN